MIKYLLLNKRFIFSRKLDEGKCTDNIDACQHSCIRVSIAD